MKVLAFTLLSLLGLVAAQDLSSLPACATECALNGIGATGCAVTDSACVCGNAGFLSSVQSCISAPGACSEADIQATLAFAETYCGGTPGTNGTNTTDTGSSTTTGTGTVTSSSATSEATSAESSSSETTSAEESVASSGSSETGSSTSESASAAAGTSGSFAAPTLAALGVAQLLGVAGVVVAAL